MDAPPPVEASMTGASPCVERLPCAPSPVVGSPWWMPPLTFF